MLQRAAQSRSQRRADAIVRVSKVGDRAGDSFVSPIEQRRSIQQACEREGLQLVKIFEELDVSGGDPLARRPGLSAALQRIEAGDTDVLVVAYFDRLFRKFRVQEEVVERVEAVGGTLLAVDVGEISARTASRWLSSSMLGLVAEYHRRITSEKTMEARADAIGRGVATFPTVIPGYRRGDDGRYVIDEREAELVRHAFEMRADARSLFEIRNYLRDNGIQRSYRSTQTLLRSRIVLGELRSGKFVNPTAHPPIIPRRLWQLAQDANLPRGPRAPSERILARLGIVRCGACGSAMGVTYGYKQRGGKKYWKYHCGSKECTARAMISATIIEDAVVAHVIDRLSAESESASVDDKVAVAEQALSAAQDALDAAVRAFDGIDAASVNASLKLLQEQVGQRDRELRELRRASTPARVVSVSGDWQNLTVDERRDLIRAVVDRVEVRPVGAGLRFEIFSQ
jgi:DNA invertase Pin-like site-specific DNA recombinase